jgi:hypothetical protein
MNHQTTETKGIYAGLSPADFVMRIRRPSLGEKLKPVPVGAALRLERAAAPDTHTIKA